MGAYDVDYEGQKLQEVRMVIQPTVLQPGGWRVPAALLRSGVRSTAWG
jgi:hypothetical protein